MTELLQQKNSEEDILRYVSVDAGREENKSVLQFANTQNLIHAMEFIKSV